MTRELNSVESLLNNHLSVREFKDRPLQKFEIEHAVSVAQMASTSSLVQAYSVLNVSCSKSREELVTLTGGQELVAKAGAFLIICGDLRRHNLIYERASSSIPHSCETFLLATIDASLFAQNLAIAFESRKLGICFIGGLRNQLDEVNQLLELPSGVLPLFGMCVGEPAEEVATKPRLPINGVLFQDRYPDDLSMLGQVDDYDEIMKQYYEDRGLKNRNWTGGLLRKFAKPLREKLASYYKSKGASFD